MTQTLDRWDNLEQAAREAYESYRALRPRNASAALPQWQDLQLWEQRGWSASVRTTLAKAYRIVAEHLVIHIQEDCARNCAELDPGGKAS